MLVAFLVRGLLAGHETHATPYVGGTPTVITQVAEAAFGNLLAATRVS